MKIYICILNKNLDTEDVKREIEQRRNELLDVYSLYLRTGIQAIKEEAIIKAFELHRQDPDFSFIL